MKRKSEKLLVIKKGGGEDGSNNQTISQIIATYRLI